jgi:IclR family pca regulon transcriptional regulator
MVSGKLSNDGEKSRDFVGSLVHGLNVIMAFDADSPQMTLSQVAEKTGMNRAGARRYLLTLAHLGFIQQNDRLFSLTPKVMDLGYSFLSTIPISKVSQIYLDTIRDKSGEAVAKANSNKLMSPSLTIGRRFPAIYASAGRVLLAIKSDEARHLLLDQADFKPLTGKSITSREVLMKELDRIRLKDYAFVDQEIEHGVRSLAVPVFNQSGESVAAISMLTNASTVTKKKLINDYLPMLWDAAQEIKQVLAS